MVMLKPNHIQFVENDIFLQTWLIIQLTEVLGVEEWGKCPNVWISVDFL